MVIDCGGQPLDLSRPVIMGVLNRTPDSFSDGGRNASLEDAVAAARRMHAEGAAIIDIGGESTRPGAPPVPLEEELQRVIPLIARLAGSLPAILSIDTMKPEVMRAATAAGARLVNDVRALLAPGALEAAAASGAAVCVMHMQGDPRTMQVNPVYADVVTEVHAFLAARVQACRDAGIPANRILVDPGFGFGKTLAHNLALLAGLPRVSPGPPLLVGLSRKSMLRTLLGREVGERLAGSLALAALAVTRGARIVRTHDVAATRDAVEVAWAAFQAERGS